MPLFTTKDKDTKQQSVQLVFDIGSASVGGALVVLTKGQKPRVLYATRRQMTFQENLNFERFVSSLFETFGEIIRLIERRGLRYLNKKQIQPDNMERALFMYASPWYMAHTKILKLTKKEPITITRELINKLVAQEKKKEEANKPRDRGDVIEQTVSAVKLNGYHVSNFEGRKAKELELTVSTTILSHNVAGGLENILKEVFHSENIRHRSFPLASFAAVRDIFHKEKSFLLLDISGEVTDLSLIKDETLLETTSFPKGTYFILRHLMKRLNLTREEGMSRIRMYSTQNLIENTYTETKAALYQIYIEWSRDFQNALERIEKELSLPNKVFYTVDGDFLPVLTRFIQETDTKGSFDTHSIGYAEIKDYVDFAGDKTHDIFIGIGTYSLNKEFQM